MKNLNLRMNLGVILRVILISLLGSGALVLEAGGAELDVAKLIKRADEARMPEMDTSVMVQIIDYREQRVVHETKYKVLSKGSDSSLVETVFPDRQKGRKLLMKKDDLWFFTPDIKRPTRVSMQQRLTGEVSYGDIARTNFAGDYDAKFVSDEEVAGKKCHKLDLKANREGVTYSRIVYWLSLDKETMPVQAEFYAVSGKLLKRAIYQEPKPILGRSRVTKVTIEDAVEKSKQSVMVYSNHKLEKLDPSIFNKDSMVN